MQGFIHQFNYYELKLSIQHAGSYTIHHPTFHPTSRLPMLLAWNLATSLPGLDNRDLTDCRFI